MKKLTEVELTKLEASLSEYKGDDRIISSHELQAELLKTEENVFKVKTGIPTLDRILQGFEMGELIVFTGPTGEGKTTLTMTITKNLASKNINCLWFTFEVTPRQFLKKIGLGGSVPLFFLPREITENYVSWIEQRIIEAKVKHNVQVVFIDHLHAIFSLSKVRNNISLEIGDIAAQIKDMCIRHNIVICLIAHGKDNADGSLREPTKQSIRDSGLISRIADSIIGVWRTKNGASFNETMMQAIGEEDTWAKMRVFKNRREGKLGGCMLDHKNHYLTELDTVTVKQPELKTDSIKKSLQEKIIYEARNF